MSSLAGSRLGIVLALGLTFVSGAAQRQMGTRTSTEVRHRKDLKRAKLPISANNLLKSRAVENYGKLPLSFEVNQGQSSDEVKFLTRGAGYTLFLTARQAVFSMNAPRSDDDQNQEQRYARSLGDPLRSSGKKKTSADVLRMTLLGANQNVAREGVDELPGKVNYFIGRDPSKWRSNIPTYAKVRYRNVYPGIDVIYYGDRGQLEYDFVVAPGADPGVIALGFAGLTEGQHLAPLRIDTAGDVLVEDGSTVLRLKKPAIYQRKTPEAAVVSGADARDSVDGHFVLTATNEVHFELGSFDRSQPLVIDPALVFSTFLGGTVAGGESGGGIGAVDAAGNLFLVGGASYPGFPTTSGVLNPTPPGGSGNAYVAEMNAAGTALIYSTFFGPSTPGTDPGCGENGPFLAIDPSDNVYLTGYTTSTTFPVTAGAFQTTLQNLQGCNAYVSKLNSTGSKLVYSTYLGGTNGWDIGYGIAADSSGNAYVAGVAGSSDFPTTLGAFQTVNHGGASTGISGDAFVTELKSDGSAPVFSTFIGGSGGENASSVALDAAGAIYVTGVTGSTDFPTNNPLQATLKGTLNAFVAKFAPGGSSLGYSTYLGGSGTDYGLGLVVDGPGDAYVSGQSLSPDFPTVNPFQATCPSTYACVFASKINPSGSALVYSTYLGGSSSQGQFGQVFAVDASGNAYIGGQTWSSDFPLLNPIQTTFGGNVDVFASVLDPTGSALVFSTYLGGSGRDRGGSIVLDSVGHLYVGGVTESTDFPVLPGAMQASFSGNSAAFVSKIDLSATASADYLLLPAPNSASVTAGGTANFNVNVMPLGEFSQTVNISCTGAPSKSTCTPSPASVTLGGADTAAITVSVATTAATAGCTASAATIPSLWTDGRPGFTASIAMLSVSFIAFCLASIRPRRRARRRLVFLALLPVLMIFLPSCGGSSSGSTGCSGGAGSSPGTPSGTYTLTVTGTSGNLNHSAVLTLTIK